MNRTPLHRGFAYKPTINLLHIQQSPMAAQKQQKMSNQKSILHQSPHISKINYTNDQNTTARVETNAVYDSMKQESKCQHLANWKILTLKQIKRSKIQAEKEERQDSCNKSQQKIYVSISKTNRNSQSKQRKHNTPTKVNLSEGDFKHLNHLAKNRFIVQTVQKQIQVDKKTQSVFCG